jgi:hypothetical protein
MKMEALKMEQNNERRVETRHACSQKIFFVIQNQFYEGELENYSHNGLFIKTKEVLQVGEVVTVADPNPDGEDKKRQGQILWKNKEGFGVELFRSRNDRENKVLRFEQRSLNRMY